MIRTVLDLVLDSKKAAEFDCGKCEANLQKLRNCNGKGSPAKIFLNGRIHTRCPVAVSLENLAARYLVNLYFRCKDVGQFPAEGGALAQTAFTVELFSFIRGEIADRERRLQAAADSKK